MPSVFQSLQDMDEQRVKMIQVQTICYEVDRIIAHQTFLEFHAEVSSNGAGRSSYCWSMPRGYSKVYRLNQWKRGKILFKKINHPPGFLWMTQIKTRHVFAGIWPLSPARIVMSSHIFTFEIFFSTSESRIYLVISLPGASRIYRVGKNVNYI